MQGCPEKRTGCKAAAPLNRTAATAPLRPSGGRGRGPRSGKVRWRRREPARRPPSPCPPPGRREREITLVSSQISPANLGNRLSPGQPCGAMEMSSRPKLRYVSSCMNSRSAPLVAGGTRFVATNSLSGRINPKSATGARLRPRSDLQASARNAASSSAAKRSISLRRSLSNRAMSAVEQLPNRIQITFGGAP